MEKHKISVGKSFLKRGRFMFKRLVSCLFCILLMAANNFYGVPSCGAEEKPQAQARDMEAARARMERRVTDQERKAVAVRQAKQHPALAAQIAKNRAVLINARNARIEQIKAANVTSKAGVNTMGGANE